MSFHYPLLLDGGMATELERTFHKDLSGLLWSAKCLDKESDLIKSVHKSYYEAGANIITTCSYQASVDGFIRSGYSKEEAIHLMQKSVKVAVDARHEFLQSHPNDTKLRLIALSIGCYGAILANGAEYTGDYGSASLESLIAFHKERLNIYLSTPVDFILFETIPSYLEAQAIQQLVSSWDELPPVAVSFQCQSSESIADGTPLLKAIRVFDGIEKVFASGINCTKPKYLDQIVPSLYAHHQHHHKVLLLYPDGGEEWNSNGWDDSTKIPEEKFGCMMANYIHLYPTIIVGGCCGTSPLHIKNVEEQSSAL
ncbi:homocysteine S-methyltransferase [Pilobolus umbonatus]|nr:homocysteine S-methyltransferase [Pilobolus umbonatus]